MQFDRLIIVALAAAVAVPSAYAQEEREKCECPSRIGSYGVFGDSDDWPQVYWFGNRPRLGVRVNTAANPETDAIGALIEDVTPGGPAEKAGMQAGDIITALDGTSLLSGDEVYDDDESAAAQRLIARAWKLDRGDTVEVEFRRGSETQTTQLVAGEFDDDSARLDAFDVMPFRLRERLDRLQDLPDVYFRGPESFALRLGASLPGLELVSLNPDLGEYFGTEEGVLVLAAPEDNGLNLKAGDVVQAIGGRTVKSPSHAMRILRSYDADEEVSFEIVRKQREMTVLGRVPEGLGSRMEIHRRRDR